MRSTAEEVDEELESGRLACITLRLYPPKQGYEVVFPGKNCIDATTKKLGYEENELLEFIGRREIPYFLADVFEECGRPVYYRGCIPVSIEDHRFHTVSTRRVILRPNLLSLLTDLTSLLNSFPNFDLNQKKQLEAKFWRLVSPQISLEPYNVNEENVDNTKKVQSNLERVNVAHSFRRTFKRCDYVRVQKKLKNDAILIKNRLPLLKGMGSIYKLREGSPLQLLKSFTESTEAIVPQSAGSWKPMLPAAKSAIVVAQKKIDSLKSRILESEPDELERLLQRVEEITVEMPVLPPSESQRTSSKTRIVVSKHKLNGIYYGQLFLESPPISSGIFLLGGEAEARLYVVQYLDMVTEAGRKQPKSVLKATPGKVPTNIVSPTPKTK